MVWIKICGITTVEDARFAEKCGADAIGVVVCSNTSPRSVPLSRAEEIFGSLSSSTTTVAVTHTRSAADIREIERTMPKAIQVFSPHRIRPGIRLIRAISPGDPVPEDCSAVIIDGSHGQGKEYDQEYARQVVSCATVPVILAGGLNPENVTRAIRDIRPYGVDVASGTEECPGKKDPRLVREFIMNSRKACSGD